MTPLREVVLVLRKDGGQDHGVRLALWDLRGDLVPVGVFLLILVALVSASLLPVAAVWACRAVAAVCALAVSASVRGLPRALRRAASEARRAADERRERLAREIMES